MVGSCAIEGLQKPMSIMSLELWKLMHLKLHNQQPVIIGKIILSIVQINKTDPIFYIIYIVFQGQVRLQPGEEAFFR